MKEYRLDKLDYEILKFIEEDCSLTYNQIAEKLGKNLWTVRDRVNLLKKREIIKGCKGVLDYEKMGYGCKAVLFMTVEPGEYSKFISELRNHEEVKKITILTGTGRIMVSAVGVNCVEIRKLIQTYLSHYKVEVKEFAVVIEEPL